MPYVVAGATGATGGVLLPLLAEQVGAEQIIALVRPTSDTQRLRALGVKLHVCDLGIPASYAPVLGPKSTYVGIIAVKTPFFPETLETLQARGVRRALFLSSTLVFSHYARQGDYFRANEERIRQSGISYTIFRPSLIYGSTPGRNSVQQLLLYLRRWPVFPLFGTGDNLMQPVYAEDLSRAVVAALGNPRAERREFNLAGPAPLPYRELVRTAADTIDRRVLLWNVNLHTATAAVRVLQRVPGFPLNERHLLRLREDKVFDIAPAIEALGYAPRPFADGVHLEAERMRACGML